jgi:hypothetical protein
MLTQLMLKDQQADLYPTFPNTQAAFEYAQKLAKADGFDTAMMTMAIMVYHNSLLQQLKGYCPEGQDDDS